MSPSIRFKLSLMMFLQFFIWGAWFVTLGSYLGLGLGWDGIRIGAMYSTMPWGALVAPLFVGMVADRFFRPNLVLAACHVFAAVFLLLASTITESATLLFWTLFCYALAYNPTLALVNAIAFRQMTDTGRQFPGVRVWGTIGWIAAGVLVGTLGVEETSIPMRIAAGASLILAGFALVLPSSPPPAASAIRPTIFQLLGLEALSLLRNRSFAIFAAGSLLLCIPLAFYYNFTNLFLNEKGVANAAAVMTLGQVSEMIFLVIMPFFFVRLGVKWMLLTGMAAWAARYVLFAMGSPETVIWMFYAGIVLHGVCYDFFFVTGQIYVDRTARPEIRAAAQGFLTLLTYGLGMLIGSWVSGWVVQSWTVVDPLSGAVLHDWKSIWLIPAGMAAGVFLLFLFFFRPSAPASSVENPPPAAG